MLAPLPCALWSRMWTCSWLRASLEPVALAAVRLWTFRLSGSCAGMSVTAKVLDPSSLIHELECEGTLSTLPDAPSENGLGETVRIHFGGGQARPPSFVLHLHLL